MTALSAPAHSSPGPSLNGAADPGPLQAQVSALQTAGVLNHGQANSLIVKLNLKGNIDQRREGRPNSAVGSQRMPNGLRNGV